MGKGTIRYLLTTLLFLSFGLNAFSQKGNVKLSPYEQKRYDLAAQTATNIVIEVPELGMVLGVSVKRSDFKDKLEEMDFFENLIESVGIAAIYSGGEDYQSYKVKEIYKEWTEKRRILDKSKTKADEQREQERKNKREETMPDRGTKGLLLYVIKKDFGKWATKGEFEKTGELMERLRDFGPDVFDSICHIYTCGRHSVALSTEATDINSLKYDADAEMYTMEFTYGDNNAPKTIIGKAPVPISFAREQRTDNIAISSLRIVHGLVIPKEIQITFYNENDSSYKAVFTFEDITGEKPLDVCFSEIGYNGETPLELLSHCFNPSEYLRAQERNQFVKDSIQKRKRFVRDSILARERFIKDSTEKRERFVRDSILARERFVIDSIQKRKEAINASNYRYYQWLNSIEHNYTEQRYSYSGMDFRAVNTDGKINKCSFEGDTLTLKCGKQQYRGVFKKKHVKNDMGEPYAERHNHEKYNIVANEDGDLVIYQFGNRDQYCFVFLIVRGNSDKVYAISESVQKKLTKKGLIK